MFNQTRGIFGAPVRKPYDPLANPMPNDGNPYPMDEQMPRPASVMGEPPMTTLPNPGSIFAGMNPTVRKPTAFEPGGIGRNIIGGLGDALATWSGGQANFHDSQMMKQKQAFAQAEADRQRAAEFADWTKKQDYEAAHPKPISNDTANDYEYIRGHLGQEAADKWLRNFAAGQPIVVRNPDGTITPISRDAFTNGTGGAAPPSTLPPDFDFGDGGPKPSASGTFPDWRGAPGTMTSGRRTVEGNRLVGGVPNSGHLRGDKADYVGTTAAALRSYYGPSAKILDERTHLDVSLPGYGRFPYYGKRGTTGLK